MTKVHTASILNSLILIITYYYLIIMDFKLETPSFEFWLVPVFIQCVSEKPFNVHQKEQNSQNSK